MGDSRPCQVFTAYLDYMEELGLLLGGQVTSTRDQMRQVLDLEVQLARITVPQDQRRDEEKIYHKMSVAELQVGAGTQTLRDGDPTSPSTICLPGSQSGSALTAHFPATL